MLYLHWSSSDGCAGGYSPDIDRRFFSRSVGFDISLAPMDADRRCQFFYDALFVSGPPSLLVVIARLVASDKVLCHYDKEWLIDCARAFYFDLTGHDMGVIL